MVESEARGESWHSQDHRRGVAYGIILSGFLVLWMTSDKLISDGQLDDHGRRAAAWVISVNQSADDSSEVSLELRYVFDGELREATFHVPRAYVAEGPGGCAVPVKGRGALRLYPDPRDDAEARRALFDRQCPGDADYATYVPWEIEIVHLESNTRIVKPVGWGRSDPLLETIGFGLGGTLAGPVFAYFYFRTPPARRRPDDEDADADGPDRA